MNRNYRNKALLVLIACLTVCENFTANQAELIAEQPEWKDPFIANYKKTVETFLKNNFGISSKTELKEATRLVISMQNHALDDLSMIKTQIQRNFRQDPIRKEVLLDLLGFKKFWVKANRKVQNELIGLVYAFVNNLSPELRTEIESKNVNKGRIDKVVGYHQTFAAANVTQETLKGSSKLDTEASVKALNEIYDTATDICQIGQKLFKADKTRRDLFVFSKIIDQQGGTNGPASNDNPPPKA